MTKLKGRAAAAAEQSALLQEVQYFLALDAELLDTWQLETWTELLAEDVRYRVPSPDIPDGNPDKDLFLVSDDRVTLISRVNQLLGTTAWVENPLSRTRRIVSNVRIVSADSNEIKITANFAIWRYHMELTDMYIGQYRHTLARNGDGDLVFKERKSVLDLQSLRPHGRLSIIL